MAVPRLGPIPFEKTTLIIKNARHEDLVALSRVCRALRLVAQPGLYREVNFTWEEHIGRHPSSLYQLLDTVQRIDLAIFVRSL